MKLSVKEVIVCEGKYDKIKLESVLDADIITLDGFGIFKSDEKKALIRRCAEKRGIIVVTDSDSAGMVIRNYIKGITGDIGVQHLYMPRIEGKESRKDTPSKEGILGVEGIDADIIRRVFEAYTGERERSPFTRAVLYGDGFMGLDNSAKRREMLCRRLGLPLNMNINALLQALPIVTTMSEYRQICEEMRKEEC